MRSLGALGTDKLGISHLLGLGLLSSGKELVGKGALYEEIHGQRRLQVLITHNITTNLERSAETEDTVVGLLGRKTLDGGLDSVALFGDQVIVSDTISVGSSREQDIAKHSESYGC